MHSSHVNEGTLICEIMESKSTFDGLSFGG